MKMFKKLITIALTLAMLMSLSVASVSAVSAKDFQRLCDDDRYGTSYEVAKAVNKKLTGTKSGDCLVIAAGTNYPDALSGGYFAVKKHAPLLLCNPKKPRYTEFDVETLLREGGTVYILGGTAAVPGDIDSRLRKLGFKVKRIQGKNRYETNLAILREAGVSSGELMLCTGTGYADNLSASAVDKPILLLGKELSEEQKRFLRSSSFSKGYVIGGESALSKDIEGEVSKYINTERVWGKTRYETSIEIAKKFFKSNDSIVLCYGQNYPDGLSAGPLARAYKAPMILVTNSSRSHARTYRQEAGVTNCVTVGATSLISDKTVEYIMDDDYYMDKSDKEYTLEFDEPQACNMCGALISGFDDNHISDRHDKFKEMVRSGLLEEVYFKDYWLTLYFATSDEARRQLAEMHLEPHSIDTSRGIYGSGRVEEWRQYVRDKGFDPDEAYSCCGSSHGEVYYEGYCYDCGYPVSYSDCYYAADNCIKNLDGFAGYEQFFYPNGKMHTVRRYLEMCKCGSNNLKYDSPIEDYNNITGYVKYNVTIHER